MKFLTCNSRLIHQAALGDREHSHTLLISAASDCIVRIDACACTCTIRARSSRCARRDRNGAHVCAEFKTTRFELIQRALVLEEYDLTKSLAAGLKADTDLAHAYVANVRSVHINPALPKGSADSDRALTDGGEYGVTIAGAKKIRGLVRILESYNRVAVTGGMC